MILDFFLTYGHIWFVDIDQQLKLLNRIFLENGKS